MALSRRSRRWLIALSLFALALAVAAWWVNRQLEPVRLTATVLEKAGQSLGVQLRFKGMPEYALKPEPRLLIPDLVVSDLQGRPFLSAGRAEISLPWATITGGEPVITRIELDRPRLDLPGLARWQASRPKTPFELPTLTDGLVVSRGHVSGSGFSLDALSLELPHLKTGDFADLQARGVFTQGETIVDFNLVAQLATPGLASDFTLQGDGSLRRAPEPLRLGLDAKGRYVSTDQGFSVNAPGFRFVGKDPLPVLDGRLEVASAASLTLAFDGQLARWPATWPALPEPLAAQGADLPLQLRYSGKSDLSDPLALSIEHDATQLQASLKLSELQAWAAAEGGSPLPPLNGTMKTPSLVFDGVELQGIEIKVSDSPQAGGDSKP